MNLNAETALHYAIFYHLGIFNVEITRYNLIYPLPDSEFLFRFSGEDPRDFATISLKASFFPFKVRTQRALDYYRNLHLDYQNVLIVNSNIQSSL